MMVGIFKIVWHSRSGCWFMVGRSRCMICWSRGAVRGWLMVSRSRRTVRSRGRIRSYRCRFFICSCSYRLMIGILKVVWDCRSLMCSYRFMDKRSRFRVSRSRCRV